MSAVSSGGRAAAPALLVAGTTSDAGKSVVTAGLLRALARRGLRVAPFKAQNMSLNSGVTPDGGEISRAQLMQAAAAGVSPEVAMNPVLLKPGSDRTSHLLLRGHPAGEIDAGSYRAWRPRLLTEALECLADLRSRFDFVICEGAGSPAEINLRADDVANMGLARAAGLPTVVVGDIDRGGVFAAFAGTLGLLDAADQALIAGFVVNKFRGDPALLAPGLDWLATRTGRPVLGVLPWRPGLWLDGEDSLNLDADRGEPVAALGADVLRVSVLRLPRTSNITDIDPLASEPGVLVRLATRPAELADADLVVLPGSRATVSDLGWLADRGFPAVLRHRAAAGRPILGLCGGYQMLGEHLDDPVESRAGRVAGLGLLPVTTTFTSAKTLRHCAGTSTGADASVVHGYEIRHGHPLRHGGDAMFTTVAGTSEGCRVGTVAGTSWHGVFENDDYRRAVLADVARLTGKDWRPGGTAFAAVREARLDALADLVEHNLEVDDVVTLMQRGVAAMPTLHLGPGAAPAPAARPAGVAR